MDKKIANKAIAMVMGFISESQYSDLFDISQFQIKVGHHEKNAGLFAENDPEFYYIQFSKIIEKPSGHCNSERYAVSGNPLHSFNVYVSEKYGMDVSVCSIQKFEKYYSIARERQEFEKSCEV